MYVWAYHCTCYSSGWAYKSSSALITTFLKPSLSSRGYESDINWETGEGHPFEYFVYGAACSEVEIDCLTGAYKVSTNRERLRAASWMHLSPTYPSTEHQKAPGIWPEDNSLYYQGKLEAQHFPWCYDCSHGKQPVASLLYFPGPFTGLKKEATSRDSM